jgi:peroxiredoxin
LIAAALALASLALAGGGDPPLRFVDLDGRAVEIAAPAAEGDAVVLHYWATWCPTCGEELATLEEAIRACEGTNVRVLTVDVGEPADLVRRYLGERGLALPVLLDPKGRTWRRDGGRELPSNLVWTARGRAVSFGPREAAAWRAELAALGCSGDRGAR